MKLNEKYEDYLLTKASQEGGRDFRRYTNKVFKEVEKNPNITKRKIRQMTRKLPINYQSYVDFIDTSLIVAPIVNYITQPEDVRKSKATRGIKEQIRRLTKNAKLDITKPKATVDKVYSIVGEMKKGNKGNAHKDFSAFLNSITPERERILNEARERLSANTKSFKKTLTGDMYKDYEDYLSLGYGKPDAIQKMVADNRIKNDHRIKRYLETEAHEDYEKAKVAHAEQNGFKYKYWRSQRDVRVRDSHRKLDGKIVKNDEHFNVGGHKALYPGDTNLPLKERINCRCSTEFAFVPRGTRKGANMPAIKPKKPPLAYPDLPPKHPLNAISPTETEQGKLGNAVIYAAKQTKLISEYDVENKDVFIPDMGNSLLYEEPHQVVSEYLTIKGKVYTTKVEKDGIEYTLKFGNINEHKKEYGLQITTNLTGGEIIEYSLKNSTIFEAPYHPTDPGYYVANELGTFKIADFYGDGMQDFLIREKLGYTPLTTKYGKDYKNEFVDKYKITLDKPYKKPKSLLDFNDNLERYIREQVSVGKTENFYDNTDEVDREIMDYTKIALERTFEKNDFGLRVDLSNNDILEGIFGENSSERFKSLHETGKGYGFSSTGFRQAVGNGLFGYDPDQMEPRDYEKYGYLVDSDIMRELEAPVQVNNYGQAVVTFKKENVASRTTFTLGDSFGYHSPISGGVTRALPQPVTDVNPQFLAQGTNDDKAITQYAIEYHNVNAGLNISELKDPNNGIVDITNFTNRKFQTPEGNMAETIGYIELQYHGDLTLSDVKDITINTKLGESVLFKTKKPQAPQAQPFFIDMKSPSIGVFDTIEDALLTEQEDYRDMTGGKMLYRGGAVYTPNTWEKLALKSKKFGFDIYATNRTVGEEPNSIELERIKLDPDKLLKNYKKRKQEVEEELMLALLD